MEKLKKEIIELSEKQRFFKQQRKTVKLVGERKVEPWRATMEHSLNRTTLRLLHAAYGLMRGKTFNQIECGYPNETHPLHQFKKQIDELILKYNEPIVHPS